MSGGLLGLDDRYMRARPACECLEIQTKSRPALSPMDSQAGPSLVSLQGGLYEGTFKRSFMLMNVELLWTACLPDALPVWGPAHG
jgi:hypothetical protein